MVCFCFFSLFFFLVCLFFKMLSRCREALLYTTPGPRALKPNGTNSKEILFPVPPAWVRDFLLQSSSDSVGVCKDPWSVCGWVRRELAVNRASDGRAAQHCSPQECWGRMLVALGAICKSSSCVSILYVLMICA